MNADPFIRYALAVLVLLVTVQVVDSVSGGAWTYPYIALLLAGIVIYQRVGIEMFMASVQARLGA